MLTKLDDHLGHQLPTTFDHVASSDPGWSERLWYTAIDVSTRNSVIAAGLGHYPNRGVRDGFAGISLAGRQLNTRMSAALRIASGAGSQGEAQVGALRFHVLEGLRRQLVVLGDNDSRFTFEFEFIASMNPHEENQHFRRLDGRVVEDFCRYGQLGRARGVVRMANGREFRLDPEHHLVQRDHSWGITPEDRPGSHPQPQRAYQPTFSSSCAAQFRDFGVHWSFVDRGPADFSYLTGEIVRSIGQQPRSADRIALVDHHFKWAAGYEYQLMSEGLVDLTSLGGERLRLQLKGLGIRYQLRGGCFGGFRGWHHGDYRGEAYFEHDVWDLTQPEIQRMAGTVGDQLVELRDDRDRVGYGVIRYGVMPGYPRYQEVQHLPYY